MSPLRCWLVLPALALSLRQSASGPHLAEYDEVPRAVEADAPPEPKVNSTPAGLFLPLDVMADVAEAEWPRQAMIAAAQRFLSEESDAPDDAPAALIDVSMLRRQAELWSRYLPRVEPFYAVKCNPQPAVVAAFWRIWQEQGFGGFDCASSAEIDLVKTVCEGALGRVVFGNPCKPASSVKHARRVGLRLMTFDNAAELDKIAELHPEAELLLRVQTDDALARCPLSNKYGAAPADCPALLARAVALGLQVVGVSFHVGSGCSERGAFPGALRRAREVVDAAERHGFNMTLLDIGGGFLGWDKAGCASFADHAADINAALEELFPSPSVRVIAEPGRFLVATAQSMLTTVISIAEFSTGDRYYLNDGLYGSFNCLLFDHAEVPPPIILRDGKELIARSDTENVPCTLFGPTCDGFDMISDSMQLPRLRVGDRLIFPDMGAYTTAACTRFNGFGDSVAFAYESLVPERGAS